jgi:predicted PurR-regulated permease PerM
MNAHPPPISSPAWTSRTKRIVMLICLLLVGLIVWRLTNILPIILVAVVLAYLFNPVTTWLDRHLLSRRASEGSSHRTLAIILTFVLLIVLLLLVVGVVVPVLVNQLQEFAERIPSLVSGLEARLETILNQPIILFNQRFVPMESIREALGNGGEPVSLEQLNASEAATTFARSLTGTAFSFLGGAVNALVNFIFLLTLMFYLLKDGGKFADNLVEVTSSLYRSDMRRLLYELSQVWDAYLRGQVILSLAMGGLVFLAATILGVPNAPILGMLSGLLEFIPTLGPALALIPATLLALGSQSSTFPGLEGVTFAVVVVIVWTVLQNIEAVVLVPRIMGDSLNLHPFVVMVGVLAGATVAGALGVILAAPVIASARVLGQYIYGKLTDRNPFPPPITTVSESARRDSLVYRFAVAVRYTRMWLVGCIRRVQGRGGKSVVD